MFNHDPLYKWNSCRDLLQIPNVPTESVRRFHIYDFDNTLYCSPHPNKQLYTKDCYNQLFNSSVFIDGGWWSEPSFLEQSFKDMLNSDEREQRQYWNDEIMELANSSYEDPEVVSIVLTGRKEVIFQEPFNTMLSEFRKVKFNAICLKRAQVGSSTAEYKVSLIREFLEHYTSLEEVVIYDDRLGQIKQFEKSFKNAKVIHVHPRYHMLNPSDERRLVIAILGKKPSGYSLHWTPKNCGFVLSRTSYKNLMAWTFRFFKKKFKMSSLPQYPLYIPCSQPVISDLEIAKIWSNNDPEVTKLPSKVEEIRDIFYSQDNFEGQCMIKFDVTEVICRANHGNKTDFFFKAIPASRKRFVSSSFTDFTVISADASSKQVSSIGNLDRPLDSGREQSIKRVRLDRPIRINTYFAHFAKLYLSQTHKETTT